MHSNGLNLKRDEFALAFESQGVPFIFEDLVHHHYIQWESVVFNQGGGAKVFHSRQAVAKMQKQGFERTVSDVQEKVKKLKELVAVLRIEVEFCKRPQPLTSADIERIFDLLGSFCAHYAYFETAYWEGVYEQVRNESSAVLSEVETSKNVIREDLNAAFFGPASLLELLLSKLSSQTDVSSDTLHWYQEVELRELFNSDRVSEEVLSMRRKAFVLYTSTDQKRMELFGQDALAFIDKFVATHTYTGRELKGVVAHGKGRTVVGSAYVMNRDYSNEALMRERMSAMPSGAILVTETTDPGMMEAFRKASAVVTNIGGLLSHAAITARELDVVCVIGTEVATQVIKTDDQVEVDAKSGIVRILGK